MEAGAPSTLARWTSPSRVASVAVLGSVLAKSLGERLSDIDLWWHLKAGSIITSTRSIPNVDPFSFTAPGKRWVVQEWGSEVLLHWIREAFGLRGIVVWRALMLFALYAIVARLIVRRMGGRIGAWVLVALVAYAGAANWTERPNLFSFVLFALTLALLERGDRSVWWFVPLAALWANLHGMVTLGLGTMALAALAAWLEVRLHRPEADALRAKRLGLVTVAAAAAVLLNPSGFGLYTHAYDLLRIVPRFVTEWASPDLHQLGPALFLVLLLTTLAALALDRASPSVPDILFTIAFAFLGLWAARNLAVSAIVLGLVAARHLPGATAALRSTAEPRPAGGTSVVVGLTGLVVAVGGLVIVAASAFPRSGRAADVVNEEVPLAAIDAVSRPGVRLYTFDVWAGHVIDRRWPNVHVYYDSRVEMYGETIASRYLSIRGGGPSWSRNLDRYCTTHVLVRPRDPIAQILTLSPDWTIELQERRSLTFARKTPAPACAESPFPAPSS